MNLVRTKILEGFILPELDISYWDFCIILAVVGIVATVLVNSVKISAVNDSSNVYEKEKRRHLSRLHARDDAKTEFNSSRNSDASKFDKMLNDKVKNG